MNGALSTIEIAKSASSQVLNFVAVFYSYATCGNMDRFVNAERLEKLENKIFRVAFVKNSGGWKGAYTDKENFDVTDSWDGPTVNFFQQAALEGKFSMNRTAPPPWLQKKSRAFFNSSSAFDYCVYATSLGYIDFCVGMFSMTDNRIAAGNFFKIYSEPLYLVVFQNDGESWNTFWKNVGNVFKPFTKGAWLFIVFFVIPFLSLLIGFHEHKTVPKSVNTCIICDSLYSGYNSFFQAAWPNEAETLSGRITILGMGFFILTIIAAYTANLAAILTANARLTTIETMDDAISAGFNFCAARNQASSLVKILNLSNRIVPGVDGMPGFSDRFQVLDSMKSYHNDPKIYCNAAIVAMEDMNEMNAQGIHCNKTFVGRPLSYMDKGIPVNKLIHEEIVHHFQVMLNQDAFNKILRQEEPQSSCPSTAEDGMSLGIVHLSGIWCVSLAFAFVGLLLRMYSWSTHLVIERPLLPTVAGKTVTSSIREDKIHSLE